MTASPFSCQYTPGFAALLHQLGSSLAISTYQAGKVVLVSPNDTGGIVQLPRSFRKAMGLALEGDKMAVATLDEVIVLRQSAALAQHYPKQPCVYDALYMPRATYYTGGLDVHDLEWGRDGLYGVNTYFSCLIKVDAEYSFTPIWQPPFITQLAAEDRCHLNGMALRDGVPAYVTAFNTGNTPKSWRPTVTTSGVVLEVASGEVIAHSLAMPHSPRLYDDGLYVLLSAKGQLVRIDTATGALTEVFQYPGFLRGMDRHGDYLFIGVSKIRTTSRTFSAIDDQLKQSAAGVLVVHIPTGELVGQLAYTQSVEEIYDIKVLPGLRRPNILSTLNDDHRMGLSTPFATYWGTPETPSNPD